MKHTYLHDVLPFLRELEREKQKQFEAYFRTAPLWLMDLFQSEIMEAGTTFIRENEPADTIFFVARGRVKATDYRISGIAYDFMKPMNLIALGGMEVILGQDTYQTTLQTETECIVTKLPRAQYEKWIYSDTEAFRMEAKLTCASLLEEERRNRLYLFLEGADRLAVLFSEWFEKYNKNDILCIGESRQNMPEKHQPRHQEVSSRTADREKRQSDLHRQGAVRKAKADC